MTRNTIAIRAGLLAVTMAVLSYSGAARGFAQTVPVRQKLSAIETQIVGTWQLVSIYEEDDGGEDIYRFGVVPMGRFMADRQGNFSFQIMNRGGRPYAANSRVPTVETPGVGIIGAMTYFGTYAVDEKIHKLKLQIATCLFRSCDQTERTAELKFSGNTMELTSATEPSPTGATYTHMVWKKECCK